MPNRWWCRWEECCLASGSVIWPVLCPSLTLQLFTFDKAPHVDQWRKEDGIDQQRKHKDQRPYVFGTMYITAASAEVVTVSHSPMAKECIVARKQYARPRLLSPGEVVHSEGRHSEDRVDG